MKFNHIKIEGSVHIPFEIKLSPTCQPPQEGGQFKKWFIDQLVNALEKVDIKAITADEPFIYDLSFSAGDDHGTAWLSSYGEDRETTEMLSKLYGNKLDAIGARHKLILDATTWNEKESA